MKKAKICFLLILLLTMYITIASKAPHEPEPITILMYHHLTIDDTETNTETISEQKFRKDMEYLRRHHYETLLPNELMEILSGKSEWPKRAVVISFDDGYESNYSIAFPILKKNGCHAVIALITSNIRNGDNGNPFFLSWEEVEDMSGSGWVSFGSHSDNLHNPDNKGIGRTEPGAVNGVQRLPNETEQEYQQRVGVDIQRSCSLIEAHTGKQVLWFAYPYGTGDFWCEKILDDLNIPISVLTKPRTICAPGTQRALPRYAVKEDTDLAALLSRSNK